MKKKIAIALIIVGGIFIIAIFALSLSRSLMGSRSSFGPEDNVSYESSSLPMTGSNSKMMMGAPAPISDSVSRFSETDSADNIPTEKKVIKNGDLMLKVVDADDSVSKITNIAKANGGDIFSSNLYEGANNIKSGTVTIKVPVANFEKAFAEVKKIASLVVRESISGQDVTEQYADLQARLKNKQAEEQQYLEIMRQAQKIQDILDVTSRLSSVRGQIEQLQGRIKLLDSQTDMSTITASISEDAQITITDKWRPFQVAKDAFNNLFKDIQKFVNFAIVLLIRVIPVLVIYLVFIWVIYLIGRKIYKKIKEKKEQPQQ